MQMAKIQVVGNVTDCYYWSAWGKSENASWNGRQILGMNPRSDANVPKFKIVVLHIL